MRARRTFDGSGAERSGSSIRRWLLVVLVALLAAGGIVLGVVESRTGSSAQETSSKPTTSLPSASSNSSPTSTTGSSLATRSATVMSPLPAHFQPWSFTATSATHWWILGSSSCGISQRCLVVVTTADGGARFSMVGSIGVPFPATQPEVDAVVTQVRFANPTDGWAFGSSLYATQDGGRTWAQVSIPGRVTQLEPGVGQVYAVVTPPCGTACTSPSQPAAALWRTSPTSNDWTLDPAAPAVSIGLAVHGRSVWVMDTMDSPDGPAIGTGLLHSTDGGNHFALEPQSVPGIECSYSPVSTTVVWAYCSGGHFMFAYRSTDAGAYFTRSGGTVSEQTITHPLLQLPNGSTLRAATATVAVVGGVIAGDPLDRTDDGGAVWQVVQPALTSTGTWRVIGFTTPTVGYAFWRQDTGGVTQVELWRTADGGATWSQVPIS